MITTKLPFMGWLKFLNWNERVGTAEADGCADGRNSDGRHSDGRHNECGGGDEQYVE